MTNAQLKVFLIFLILMDSIHDIFVMTIDILGMPKRQCDNHIHEMIDSTYSHEVQV